MLDNTYAENGAGGGKAQAVERIKIIRGRGDELQRRWPGNGH